MKVNFGNARRCEQDFDAECSRSCSQRAPQLPAGWHPCWSAPLGYTPPPDENPTSHRGDEPQFVVTSWRARRRRLAAHSGS
jgi:hypothetical protein